MKEQINKYAKGKFEYNALSTQVNPADISCTVYKNVPYTGRIANVYQSGSSWYITPFTTTVATGTTGTNQRTEYTTGASKVAESYHIYDVAGNIWEWTEEKGGASSVNDNYRVNRGGSCDDTSGACPACSRGGGVTTSHVVCHLGFRAVLYIK